MTRVRTATRTIPIIDTYCAYYRSAFRNVRHFEQFTQLILGFLVETKRKSLPRLAKTVRGNHQALHHFLTQAHWSVQQVRTIRLGLIQQALAGDSFMLCLEAAGDRKKGKSTDYVAHQYLADEYRSAYSIVSVTAYGVLGTTTFPLGFRVYKPIGYLKPGDTYKSVPQLACELIEEILDADFEFSVVLADCFMGEGDELGRALDRQGLRYVLGVRTNQIIGSYVHRPTWQSHWRHVPHVGPAGTIDQRFVRDVLTEASTVVRFYELTTNPTTVQPDTTLFLASNLSGSIEQSVGNSFGLTTWSDHEVKRAKDELGWADHRLTEAASIERWWEVILCAYTLVSLQGPDLTLPEPNAAASTPQLEAHSQRDHDVGWKRQLNHLRRLL